MVLKVYIQMKENVNQYNIDAQWRQSQNPQLVYISERADLAISLTFHYRKVSWTIITGCCEVYIMHAL